MSINTAKTTDPIWDSRNSDEPAFVPTPCSPALPGSWTRGQCVEGLAALREAARELDKMANRRDSALNLEWLLAHISAVGFPAPENEKLKHGANDKNV